MTEADFTARAASVVFSELLGDPRAFETLGLSRDLGTQLADLSVTQARALRKAAPTFVCFQLTIDESGLRQALAGDVSTSLVSSLGVNTSWPPLRIMELLAAWKQARPDLSTDTVASARGVFVQLVKFSGDLLATDVGASVVTRFRAEILARAKPVTWNSYRRQLRAVWAWANECELLFANPWASAKTASEEQRPPKTVTAATLGAVFRAIDASETSYTPGSQRVPYFPFFFWRAVIICFLMTGIRLRQLVELTWSDVDLDARVITVTAAGNKTKREYQLPIIDELADSLADVRRRTVATSGLCRPDGVVFNLRLFGINASNRVADLQRSTVTGFFRRMSERLGVKISAHRLRHTAASFLSRAGVNLATIQDILGHSDIRTTRKYIWSDLRDFDAALSLLPSQYPGEVSACRQSCPPDGSIENQARSESSKLPSGGNDHD